MIISSTWCDTGAGAELAFHQVGGSGGRAEGSGPIPRGAIVALCVVAAACTPLLVAAPSTAEEDSIPTVVVSSHGKAVKATRGSSCTTRRSGPRTIVRACGDAGYPLPKHGSVPVHPQGTVVLELSVVPQEVHVSLRDAKSRRIRTLSAERIDASGRRFRVLLPRGKPAPTLGVFIYWPSEAGPRNDADYEAAMSEHAHVDQARRGDAESAATRAASRRARKLGYPARPSDFRARCQASSSLAYWRCSVVSRGRRWVTKASSTRCEGTVDIHPRRNGFIARRGRMSCRRYEVP